MASQGNTWSLFLRYQAQAERHYRRAVEEFDRLKALRANYQTKPFWRSNPKKTKPLVPHRPNPFQPPAEPGSRWGRPSLCVVCQAPEVPRPVLSKQARARLLLQNVRFFLRES